MNNRRKLIVALGASALTSPFALFGQPQGKVWRIGYLSTLSRQASLDAAGVVEAFLLGLRELGYVEGKNLVIEWRFADGNYERLPSLATELVQLKVEVILGSGTPATSAAQKATTIIPIVMASSNDPIGSGFVKSLARPGGNITGLSNFAGDVSSKYLEMLTSMVPKLSRVAVLLSPSNSGHRVILEGVEMAARRIGVKVLPVEARGPEDIKSAFSRMAGERVGAVIVATDALFNEHRRLIAELAVKHRLPSIAANRIYPEAGGLMSYGQNLAKNYRRAATYVDKIFKGAKPGDLPVEQPMTLELIINRKTAKELGLTIPQSLLISADKVIE
jgi:putative ABC transport system substrate-binding protein